MAMENSDNLSLSQRFQSDTPLPFKIAQLVGIVLMGFAGLALAYHMPISITVLSNIGVAGTVLSIGSPFVAKDAAALKGGVTLDNINTVVTDILGQYNQLKDITNKPFIPEPISDTVDSLKDAVVAINQEGITTTTTLPPVQETTTTTTTATPFV